MADYDVIVIGAGCGGLTVGALLARQGRKVLVLEQSDRVGGCCSTFRRDGYHFDVGASIVEMLFPIERVFAALGTTLEAEVDLIPCEPMMSCMFPDGSRLVYPTSLEKTREVIATLSPEQARQWSNYAAFFDQVTDVVYNTLFSEPADSLWDLVRMVRKDSRLLRYFPLFFDSFQGMIQKYFAGTRIEQTLAYYSFYFGLPPELLTGPFALAPIAEHRGAYYPRGGMIQLPKALQRCGQRYGMETWLGKRVEKVLVSKRRVDGVRLADRTEITSPIIVSNTNAKSLYLDMIGAEHLPRLSRIGIKSYQYGAAVPMIYLGIDYRPPLESQHTLIAPSVEELNHFWRNRARQPIPHRQFGLISWPTRADPSLAPAGHHMLNIVPMGSYDLNGLDWNGQKRQFVEDVVHYLSDTFIPDLDRHIKFASCASPLDFEQRLLLPKGSPFGLQQDLAAQTIFRPANRSKSIRGLYLAGASTNPGGAVPCVIASGAITARLVERYEANA